MNALVKKEVRLLAPAGVVALLLALVPVFIRPDDSYIIPLLLLGLLMMALSTFGRESTCNTFSALLAQPAERLRLWHIKVSVLVAAFLLVFGVWLACFIYSSMHGPEAAPHYLDNFRDFLFMTSLIAAAVFTGGLWATLLLRQVAAAFWLAVLVPSILCSIAALLAVHSSDEFGIAALACILGGYSLAGFFYARWLFFRAQDIGWLGGNIVLPDWRIFSASSASGVAARKHRPFLALLKKELRLQQGSLIAAIGLLLAHTGIIVLRSLHEFKKDSAGQMLASVFWMLWLVLPGFIGCMAVAEERRIGIMESQLCLPYSRRRQFLLKVFLTLLLGVVLGGLMPIKLEYFAGWFGAPNPFFAWDMHNGPVGLTGFKYAIIGFSAALALVSFFGSSLAKNFLQAIGISIVTFIACTTLLAAFQRNGMFPFDRIPRQSVGSFLVAVYATTIALLWLAWLNYKNFRQGWPLYRRILFGLVALLIFIQACSSAIRWLDPELAHSAMPFALAIPTIILAFLWFSWLNYKNVCAGWPFSRRLVLGLLGLAVFIALSSAAIHFLDPIPPQSVLPLLIGIPAIVILLGWLSWLNYKNPRQGWPLLRRILLGLFSTIVFIALSSATIYNRAWEVFQPAEPPHGAPRFSLADPPRITTGFTQVELPDGRIWICPLWQGQGPNRTFLQEFWDMFADPFPSSYESQFITSSNWLSSLTRYTYIRGYNKLIPMTAGIHQDGTLWLATNSADASRLETEIRLGDQANWQQITYSPLGPLLLNKDGTLWRRKDHDTYAQVNWQLTSTWDLVRVDSGSNWTELYENWPGYARKADGSVWTLAESKSGIKIRQETNMEQSVFHTMSTANNHIAYIKSDGTLWVGQYWDEGYRISQFGTETNWSAVALSQRGYYMVSIRSDGTLWSWQLEPNPASAPTRLGIHNDWVAIAGEYDATIALAADGTLWYWPDRDAYKFLPLKLPKQPKKLASIFETK